jgi:hypothetical protein
MKEGIVVKGKVTIEVIDKITGKVKQKVEFENAFLNNGAFYVIELFRVGTGSSSLVISPLTRVFLYDSTKTQIKYLDGSYNTSPTDTGTAYQNTLTANDSSTDAYTVYYLQITQNNVTTSTYGAGAFAQKPATAISKASTDVLKITWTLSVGYASAPS